MSHLSSPREEFETVLQPLTSVPLERELPLGQRLWQQGWFRKSLILILLAVLWEAASRYTNNDLLLPSFMQTAHALYDGLLSGELLGKVWISLVVLIKGYLIGIVLAFGLTTLAVSTQFGRDLLSTLTSMFNPLPAIALLPLALLWFGWAFAWRTLIAAELVFGATSGKGGLGWYIFQNRNELYTDKVFAGLAVVILIGLLVENLVFDSLERMTVRRWGMVR